MTLIYIGLGSNLNNPIEQIKKAIAEISNIPESKITSTSSLYSNPPYGVFNRQPDYINAVVELKTNLSPKKFLYHAQHIEKMQGRRRTSEKWASRILDIDILLFGNLVLKTPTLVLPHYDIKNRVFMLLPILEISPNLSLPDGTSIKKLLEKFDLKKIKKLK